MPIPRINKITRFTFRFESNGKLTSINVIKITPNARVAKIRITGVTTDGSVIVFKGFLQSLRMDVVSP
jgi:hypothetical protein